MSTLEASSNSSEYLLLLRQPAGSPPQPEQLQKIMLQFHDWMELLRARHGEVRTHGLSPTAGVVLRGDSITDGPFIEAHEVVGGYVLLSAASLEEAVISARACPGLKHGMAVEVRPVVRG